MVLAIEAVEGTDQTIRRRDSTVDPVQWLKLPNPSRTSVRYADGGLNTLEALITSKARVLGVEAGATFLLDREELLSTAEKHGITVVALDELANKDN